MALALYRRYRPDTFEGVIGQDQVTVPLMRALDSGRLAHAYLFSGPRGCGKTSMARILARCVNCEQGPTSHPCGECESCKELATGGSGSMDVVEIDAASHNGVEDARELRERAVYGPSRDRYKIFILDEAHMVTPQGFNALLKVVEEPPEHVMFIFATTEPDKVIGTIRSRTHHYPFRLVPQEIMGPFLEHICEQESVEAEPGVLQLAMRAGGGSVRDTLSVLDQLIGGAHDGEMDLSSTQALLGFTPESIIQDAIEALRQHDGAALYAVVSQIVIDGYDPKRFVEDILARIRDLLILALAGEQAERTLGDQGLDTQVLREQAQALGLQYLTRMAQDCNNTLATLSNASSARLSLELLVAQLLVHEQEPITSQDSSHVASSGAQYTSAEGQPGSERNREHTTPTAVQAAHSAPQHHAVLDSTVDHSANNPNAIIEARREQHNTTVTSSARREASLEHTLSAISSSQLASTHIAQHNSATESTAPIDTEHVDERWDALVAGLPDEVAQYVNRTKIPKVLLTTHGRPSLWVKFDSALSKYAFALAVSNEEIHGTRSVVDILRIETKRVFGEQVVFAPTKKLMDGTQSVPYSKLSSQEQQKIKAKLLQSKLQSQLQTQSPGSIAAESVVQQGEHEHQTKTMAAHDTSHSGGNGDGTEADDSDADTAHAASATDAVHAVFEQKAQLLSGIEVPHIGNTDLTHETSGNATHGMVSAHRRKTFGNAQHSSDSDAGYANSADGMDSADPWGITSTSTGIAYSQGPAYESTSSLQPIDYTADPWAQPIDHTTDPWTQSENQTYTSVSAHASADAVSAQTISSQPTDSRDEETAAAYSLPASREYKQFEGRDSEDIGGYDVSQDVPQNSVQQTLPSVSPVAQPTVDPELDEYDVNDEVIENVAGLQLNQIQAAFRVKDTQEFEADDPRNPLVQLQKAQAKRAEA